MFRNRNRLKPIRDICQRCGRTQRRSASSGRPSWWKSGNKEEDPPQLTFQDLTETNRSTWAARLEKTNSHFARSAPPHLQREPRLNDLRPRVVPYTTSAVASSSRQDTIPPGLSRSYTHLLRRILDLHSWEEPDPSEAPRAYLFGRTRLLQTTLSRQDIHATIHACVRNGRPMIAARFLDDLLAQNLADAPQTKARIARKSLAYLFKACTYQLESQRLAQERAALEREQDRLNPNYIKSPTDAIREYILEPSNHPFFTNIAPPPEDAPAVDLLAILNSLVGILRQLQDLRNPRPMTVYKDLIAASVSLRRPDIAAGIYTGMVEEWVMEGRLALGAQLEHFHQGGGPPVEGREELELASDLLKTWWKGIRSWSLPGEVLSPHARLDLWHPRKTSPDDRLRHFPLPNPTSPPSLVPAPDEDLLNIILVSLSLDSAKAPLEGFQASMRACATLANTIHSRTLPYISKASLILVLGQVPYLPKVYSEGVDPEEIENRDEWAYTAYTHVHLALQSLLWTPTTPVNRVQAIAAQSREQGTGLGGNVYGMAPLSLPACRALMKYGFRKLQSLSSAVPTFQYLSSTFSPRSLSGVLADMFHAAITSRNENMMVQSKRMVFATQESRRLLSEEDARRETAPHIPVAEVATPMPTEAVEDTPSMAVPANPLTDNVMSSGTTTVAASAGEENPDASKSLLLSDAKVDDFLQRAVNSQTGIGDEDSIDNRDESELRFMALFRYYVWMNKPRMIEKLVRELMPQIDEPGTWTPDPLYTDLKPPRFLRPRTYKMALWSLRMTRQTPLAQKVFHQALLADSYWKKRFGLHGALRDGHRTLIHTYAIMINVWKDTYHYSPTVLERTKSGRPLRPNHGPLDGFSVPPNLDSYSDSPVDQGLIMILHIYSLARAAWMEAAWDPVSQRIIPGRAHGIAPDTMFVRTVLDALAPRWGVFQTINKICDIRGNPVGLLEPHILHEVKSFINDMQMFGVPLPSILRLRVMDPEDAVLLPKYHTTVPKPRTVRVMNRLRSNRQMQDKYGRVIIYAGRIQERWDNREPAADLWQWQARGGGVVPKSAAFKAMHKWRSKETYAVGTTTSPRQLVGFWEVVKDEKGERGLVRNTAMLEKEWNERGEMAHTQRIDPAEVQSMWGPESGAGLKAKAADRDSQGRPKTLAPGKAAGLGVRGEAAASEKEERGFEFKPSYS